jgi:hypothetical protein
MRSLPLPLRVAAGLAAIAVEQARTLPAKLAGLPVTVASQVLQLSMRVQQQITELAIKGDEVLAVLRPVEEIPEWATFDEDVDHDTPARSDPHRRAPFDHVADDDEPVDADELDLEISASANGRVAHPDSRAAAGLAGLDGELGGLEQNAPDPWALEERSLAEETEEHVTAVDQSGSAGCLPAGLANYDALSLPQLRARLRMLSAEDLQALLQHERTHRNRPSFVGMLTRRIATLHDQR